jgi:hypothetical protein
VREIYRAGKVGGRPEGEKIIFTRQAARGVRGREGVRGGGEGERARGRKGERERKREGDIDS